MYLRIVTGIEHVLSEGLARISVACYRHPKITLATFLIFVGVMAAGIYRATTETQVNVLWTDPNGIPAIDGNFVEDVYGEGGEFATLIATSPDRSLSTNILTLAVLSELFALHDQIVALEVGSPALDYEDLCVRILTGECLLLSPLKHWNFNSSEFAATVSTDEDVQTVLARTNFPGEWS